MNDLLHILKQYGDDPALCAEELQAYIDERYVLKEDTLAIEEE